MRGRVVPSLILLASIIAGSAAGAALFRLLVGP